MSETQQFDIAIIGAGIAGTALAAALSGSGLSIALVEAQPLTRPELPTECDLQHFDPRGVEAFVVDEHVVDDETHLDARRHGAERRPCREQREV